MAAPEQQQAGQQDIAALFQNVGQGLVLVAEYVGSTGIDDGGLSQQLLAGFEQLVQVITQGRQGGGGGSQPVPQEAGAAQTQQAF